MGLAHPATYSLLVAHSDPMKAVLDTATRVAQGSAKVLITGESGVGKDLLARFIHAHSHRASRPFIPINCAGLAETLLESELFGHVRGSFTGAHRDKMGKLQLAHRGSVFLDEVGEMTVRMQGLLLRFLENGEIQPVGAGTGAPSLDVRVVAATNRDLRQCVRDGTFREDLLYRLEVVHLRIPPLRERREDLRALIEHLAMRSEPALSLSSGAMEALLRYEWPGNVRELQNVMEQLAVMAPPNRAIGAADLPPAIVSTIRPEHAVRRPSGVADDLYEGVVSGRLEFWNDVYTRFLNRDMTRSDLRQFVRRGLEEAEGNYRALLRLLRMRLGDYKRLMNFLAAHGCAVDFREFRRPAGRTRGIGWLFLAGLAELLSSV